MRICKECGEEAKWFGTKDEKFTGFRCTSCSWADIERCPWPAWIAKVCFCVNLGALIYGIPAMIISNATTQGTVTVMEALNPCAHPMLLFIECLTAFTILSFFFMRENDKS